MTTTVKLTHSESNGKKAIEEAIFEAITEARQTCELNGGNSADCAVAWDIVEELQAEKSHQQYRKTPSTLENYCATHPYAIECRLYDI